MLKVTIAEPIPSLNKGEAAILRGIQEALRMCGNVSLTLYSPSAWINNDRKRYGDEINLVDGLDLWDSANGYMENPAPRTDMYFLLNWIKLLLFSLLARTSKKLTRYFIKDKFLLALSDADVILAGHDGMLSSDHFWVVLAARIMGKPIALFGGGNDFEGRINSVKIRKFLKIAIHNAVLCTVRDENTRNSLIANDVAPDRVRVFPDPAVLLKPCGDERVGEIMRIEDIPNRPGRPLFGLIPVIGGIVYEKSFSYEADPAGRHGLRIKLWVDLILHLLDTTNAHLVLIPHCIGPTAVFDDRRMMNDIFKAIPGDRKRITLMRNEYSEGEFKGLMKRCAFVLGERAHALIGAASVATPCAALTVKEDLRMHNIIGGMFKRKLFNLNNPDMESLKKMLTEEWNNRSATASEMAARAVLIHSEALKSAKLLQERLERYFAKTANLAAGSHITNTKHDWQTAVAGREDTGADHLPCVALNHNLRKED